MPICLKSLLAVPLCLAALRAASPVILNSSVMNSAAEHGPVVEQISRHVAIRHTAKILRALIRSSRNLNHMKDRMRFDDHLTG